MTATKLRAIAARIEQVCIETRKVMTGITVACVGCRADADALREFAEGFDGQVAGENGAAHTAAAPAHSSTRHEQHGPTYRRQVR